VRLIEGWPLSFYGFKTEGDNRVKVALLVDENKDIDEGHVPKFIKPYL